MNRKILKKKQHSYFFNLVRFYYLIKNPNFSTKTQYFKSYKNAENSKHIHTHLNNPIHTRIHCHEKGKIRLLKQSPLL